MAESILPKFADANTAASLATALAPEYAVVKNPSYIHPPYEIYPLSKKAVTLPRGLAAAVMDMDGTTTTTEPICLHSLSTMVRKTTGNAENPAWPGLDHERDYPHIIGNSTTRHVEYLMRAYEDGFSVEASAAAWLQAAAWTLEKGADPARRAEVENNARSFGVGALITDPVFMTLRATPSDADALADLMARFGAGIPLSDFATRVRAAVDIYYQRYHEILARISSGNIAGLAREVLGQESGEMIRAMPGVAVFLALVKGWLGAEAGKLAGTLQDAEASDILTRLGAHFEANPAKVGVVTSSIRYEADIVLGAVFAVLRTEIAQWPLGADHKQRLLDGFASPAGYYDAIVTATDSSEIRLKPHRDLYSIALHQLGLAPKDFDRVVGFEDSESGLIAIRAAGIPVCCAVPFAETQGHDLSAASLIAHGGLPEVMLKHSVFLGQLP
jgi:beta-phosphoglucomutase-like phosphatase (HAD superfamily)